ncbi:hypothetical protein B398_04580 [Xylella fastidiosa 32]|nr:hypothetical protein B398_04580 [Xylella fastidiosa 32]
MCAMAVVEKDGRDDSKWLLGVGRKLGWNFMCFV